jgi:hypothetical protein
MGTLSPAVPKRGLISRPGRGEKVVDLVGSKTFVLLQLGQILEGMRRP